MKYNFNDGDDEWVVFVEKQRQPQSPHQKTIPPLPPLEQVESVQLDSNSPYNRLAAPLKDSPHSFGLPLNRE